jgi:hypothetical protein
LNIVVYINVNAATIMGLTSGASRRHHHCCTNVPPFQGDAFKGAIAGFHEFNSIDLWPRASLLRLATFSSSCLKCIFTFSYLSFPLDSLLVL